MEQRRDKTCSDIHSNAREAKGREKMRKPKKKNQTVEIEIY